jgi:hypothetical protein
MTFLHNKKFSGSYSDPLVSFVERNVNVGAAAAAAAAAVSLIPV